MIAVAVRLRFDFGGKKTARMQIIEQPLLALRCQVGHIRRLFRNIHGLQKLGVRKARSRALKIDHPDVIGGLQNKKHAQSVLLGLQAHLHLREKFRVLERRDALVHRLSRKRLSRLLLDEPPQFVKIHIRPRGDIHARNGLAIEPGSYVGLRLLRPERRAIERKDQQKQDRGETPRSRVRFPQRPHSGLVSLASNSISRSVSAPISRITLAV